MNNVDNLTQRTKIQIGNLPQLFITATLHEERRFERDPREKHPYTRTPLESMANAFSRETFCYDSGGCRSLYRLPCRVDHAAGVDRIELTPSETPAAPPSLW